MKKWIKRCDMFSIIQFTRYNGQKSYRTVTGGIVSIILYCSLLAVFVGLLMETLNYTNITVTSEDINFQINPTYYELVTNTANNFMFAVGITGKNINLASFDIVLQNYVFDKTKDNQSEIQSILLKPCNSSQWKGINNEITQSFHGLNLNGYLCPPIDFILEMQGKPTSDIFKYAMISVAECGKFDPDADCQRNRHSHGRKFDVNLNQKLNFFYINSQVNPKNKDAVSYYIEDINIFDLDLSSSFTANIYFSEYEIKTDCSLMPWSSNQVERGIFTKGEATTQSHALQDGVYAQIVLRKSSQKLIIERSFEKITKPISYIGGLSNPILMVLSVLRMYTIYAYEIQFGGKIFKQETNSSFDSQKFNFITYIKCRIYNIFKNFSFTRHWASIKDYYQCRRQSIRQLDVHLLYKKMQFFEEACNILLQHHYQIGLHLLPKRSIEASQKSRLRYFYHTSISQQQKHQQPQQNRSIQQHLNLIEKYKQNPHKLARYQRLIQLQNEFALNFKKLKFNSQSGDERATEIMNKLKEIQINKVESACELYPEQFSIPNANLTMLSELVDTEMDQKGSPSKSPKKN